MEDSVTVPGTLLGLSTGNNVSLEVHLRPCCIIRVPMDFNDGGRPIPKRFIVVGHHSNAAIAIKATSKTEYFSTTTKGVVFCPSGECAAFQSDTVIDPANCFAMPHASLERYDERGQLEHLGIFNHLIPLLTVAVDQNLRIEPARRNGLLGLLRAFNPSTQH